jgi:hypothetical protein
MVLRYEYLERLQRILAHFEHLARFANVLILLFVDFLRRNKWVYIPELM